VRTALLPASVSGDLVGSAGEEIEERLGRDFDQASEPQHGGWPLAVVDEPVSSCSPEAKERRGLDEVEDGR
jgi:hypothetical protein